MNFFQKLHRKYKEIIRKRQFNQAHANHAKQHEKEYAYIASIVEKYREGGGLNHPAQFYKLHVLMRCLEEKKPQSILEFGSGTTTAILADYAKKNNAKVVSVDENARWAENTRTIIGDNPHIDIRVFPRVHALEKEPVEIKYDCTFDDSFDMVLIDGPDLSVDRVKYKNAVNLNVFDLPERPRTILVSVRKATAEYILENYSDHYDGALSAILKTDPIKTGYNYFSVFSLK